MCFRGTLCGMSTTPANATAEFAARLTELRHRTGDPSYRSIARAVTQLMDGTLSTSHETMRLMHEGGKDPGVVKLEALIGLARYYHVTADQLGSIAERRLSAAWPRAAAELVGSGVTACFPLIFQPELFDVLEDLEPVIDLRRQVVPEVVEQREMVDAA